MSANTRKKIRDTIKKIRADMEDDPILRKAVKENHIRVLHERGGLNLGEIIMAHDMGGWCPGSTSHECTKLSLSGVIRR